MSWDIHESCQPDLTPAANSTNHRAPDAAPGPDTPRACCFRWAVPLARLAAVVGLESAGKPTLEARGGRKKGKNIFWQEYWGERRMALGRYRVFQDF